MSQNRLDGNVDVGPVVWSVIDVSRVRIPVTDVANRDTEELPRPGFLGEPVSARSTPSVKVQFGAMSHIGKVRAKNQDHFLISRIARTLDVLQTSLPAGELPDTINDDAYGMVVADGMGGMAAGEHASLLAIRTGLKLVLESPRWALRIDEHEARQLIERMRQYFLKVDEALVKQTHVNPRLTGMGTTLTVAYSVGAHAFVVHAGDSRAYLFRAGHLHQLTHDHTLAQSLADLGAIPPKDVAHHASRHILTNFAGGPKKGINPEISTLALCDGDRLLLCTDGLTGMVPDEQIIEILDRIMEPKAAAEALVERALERGGKDNVTVVLAQYAIPVEPISADSTVA
jgi:PPM family protein phosphatase